MTNDFCFNCGCQQSAPPRKAVGKFAWLMFGTGVGCWLVVLCIAAGFVFQHARHFFKGFSL